MQKLEEFGFSHFRHQPGNKGRMAHNCRDNNKLVGSWSEDADGKILYNCFRCGMSGAIFPEDQKNSRIDYPTPSREQETQAGSENVANVKLEITEGDLNEEEVKYWQQYGITQDILQLYKVGRLLDVSVDGVKTDYSKFNAVFVYKFHRSDRTIAAIKVYQPLQKKWKFRWFGKKANVRHKQKYFGYEQLTQKKYVIIAAGEKDVMTLRGLGYDAVTLNSETAQLKNTDMKDIENFIVLYDADETGQNNAHRLLSYERVAGSIDLPNPGEWGKDISDYVKAGKDISFIQNQYQDIIEEIEERKKSEEFRRSQIENTFNIQDNIINFIFRVKISTRGNIRTKIDLPSLGRFLKEKNICKINLGGTILGTERNPELYQISENIAKIVTRNQILDIVSKEIEQLFAEIVIDEFNLLDILHSLFLSTWHKIDALIPEAYIPEILRDSNFISYFKFKDKVVEIHANAENFEQAIKIKKHTDYPFPFFEHELLDYPYLEDYTFDPVLDENIVRDFEYNQFLDRCLTSPVFGKHALGYHLINHKNPGFAYATVMADNRVADGISQGRTGKSLVIESLKKLTTFKVIQDMNKQKVESRFMLAGVKEGIDTIMILECDQHFNFSNFKEKITGSIDVEEKNKNAISIPFKHAPKFVFTTNHLSGFHGSSMEDRFIILTFTNYYTTKRTPYMEFGRMFFDDWQKPDWDIFYSMMFMFVFAYQNYELAGRRLVHSEETKKHSEYLKYNNIKKVTKGSHFVDFVLSSDLEYKDWSLDELRNLYISFKTDQAHEDEKQTRIPNPKSIAFYVKTINEAFGIESISYRKRDGLNNMQTFVNFGKHEDIKEMWDKMKKISETV